MKSIVEVALVKNEFSYKIRVALNEKRCKNKKNFIAITVTK
jgi:hypothetical protein